MDDENPLSVEYLLARAEQCRAMSRQSFSRDIAKELDQLAQDYERDASEAAMARPIQQLTRNV